MAVSTVCTCQRRVPVSLPRVAESEQSVWLSSRLLRTLNNKWLSWSARFCCVRSSIVCFPSSLDLCVCACVCARVCVQITLLSPPPHPLTRRPVGIFFLLLRRPSCISSLRLQLGSHRALQAVSLSEPSPIVSVVRVPRLASSAAAAAALTAAVPSPPQPSSFIVRLLLGPWSRPVLTSLALLFSPACLIASTLQTSSLTVFSQRFPVPSPFPWYSVGNNHNHERRPRGQPKAAAVDGRSQRFAKGSKS